MNLTLLAPNIFVDLSNCDLEPIHIPSLIQPHGMLLAARASDLRLVYTSQNAPLFLGVAPIFILGKTLPELLGAEAIASIEKALGNQEYVPKNIRTLSFPTFPGKRFDVTAHRTSGFLCVELENAAETQWELLAAQLEDATSTLGGPRTLRDLCTAIPPVVRRLTGYDRIMVYQFDPEGHGEVVAEERAEQMEPFLGLHYPATDIPAQARKLYLLQRFRTIVDINYVPVPLLANPALSLDQPLDMTYCGLRSVSPIHIEYLQNMGVGASLAISLIVEGKLWGMIVGHHRSPRHLPPESRALCDLLGQLTSLLIGDASRADVAAEYQAERSLLKLLSVSFDRDLSLEAGFAQSADALLALVAADGAIVRIGGDIALLGKTPLRTDSLALLAACLGQLHDETLFTDNLGALLPAFAHLASSASGALLVPLHEPYDGILWIRQEVAQTVRWAGKPEASKQFFEGTFRISPRKSFALWEEVQRGRSLPWRAVEIAAASSFQGIAARLLLQRREAEVVRLSITDLLTGLPNRMAIIQEIGLWQTTGNSQPATLLFLDLDGFKRINDRFGYRVGDDFLAQTGQRLASLIAPTQHLARLGGDEFAIFCEQTDLRQAKALASRIRESLAQQPLVLNELLITSTCSIGIAPVLPGSGTMTSDPLRVADSAMYVAKHKGGDQFSIVESREQAEILRQAIEQEVIAKRSAAQELASSYADLRSVMDSTSEAVLEVARDWTVLYGNRKAAEILPDFQVGRSLRVCFPAFGSEAFEQDIRDGMEVTQGITFEHPDPYSGQWYGGNIFPTEQGMSIFFRNVTEERVLRAQLATEQILREKRIEALSHMAGGLAHEISNPLAIIHVLAADLRLLAEAETPPPSIEIRNACDSILMTATRASNILRGLRGFARGGTQDRMQPASIYEIVEQCVELQQARFESNDIRVELLLDPDIPRFFCREVQIGQIVTNLLNNAFDVIIQSSAVIRWVLIHAKASPTEISLSVTDSGPGIEDRFRPHLMEPFFTTKEFDLGMGIGLSLSRAIAQDHGGTLTLLADTPHTTFQLTLPIAPEPVTSLSAPLLAGVPS